MFIDSVGACRSIQGCMRLWLQGFAAIFRLLYFLTGIDLAVAKICVPGWTLQAEPSVNSVQAPDSRVRSSVYG